MPKRPKFKISSRHPINAYLASDASAIIQGAVGTVENLPLKSGQKVRVAQLGKTDTGRLILTDKIVEAGGTDLPAGTYNFTFSAD